jgi:hypothetical protein
MVNADGIGQPANAPGQEARILSWLITETGGLTQLQALQHLAVARLAAMVYRLKGRGHSIRTELIEVPTRYGPAKVACYHLVHVAKGFNVASIGVPAVDVMLLHPDDRPEYGYHYQAQLPLIGSGGSPLDDAIPGSLRLNGRVPKYQCSVCCDQGKLRAGTGTGTVPCHAEGCRAGAIERRATMDHRTAYIR